MDEVLPVHLKILHLYFQFQYHFQQYRVIARVNVHVYGYPKFDQNWTMNTRYGKKLISPILLVVIVILQFESQHLKNYKSYIQI